MSKKKSTKSQSKETAKRAPAPDDSPDRVSVSSSPASGRRRVERLPDPVGIVYGPFGRRATNYASLDAVEDTNRVRAPKRMAIDAQNRNKLQAIRAESQRLDEENLISQAFLDRVLDVLLGEGTEILPATSNPTWNQAAKAVWEDWWEDAPEVRGLDSGSSLERMLLRHYVVDGDMLLVQDDEIDQFQLVTADQIGAGRVGGKIDQGLYSELGVLLDDYRRIKGFEIFPYTLSGQQSLKGTRITDMDKVAYFAYRRRNDQTRGEPMAQAAFPMLHRTTDICDGAAAATQLLSRIALAITRQGAAEGAFAGSRPDDKNQQQGAMSKRVLDLGYALMFFGEQGDKIEGVDRKAPSGDIVELLKFFLRILGMPYGLSLEFTLMIWSDTSYASGKASLQQVQRNGRPFRVLLRKIYRFLYLWRISRAIENKLLPDNPEFSNFELRFPSYPMLDPNKDRAAQSQAIVDGLSSPQREVEASTSEDWETIMKERADAFVYVTNQIKQLEARGVKGLRIEDFIPRADFTSSTQSSSVTESVVPEQQQPPQQGGSTNA